MQSTNRRRFQQHLAACAALVTLPGLSACGASQPLSVALHPWVGYDTLELARNFKWLPDRVSLIEGKDVGDTLEALHSGRADAGCLTLDEMLRAREKGLPLSAALVFDVSAGADMILAQPYIRQLADFKGRRIGLEQNAVGSLMLVKLLEAAGLKYSDVVLIDLGPEEQIKAWHAGQVDAIVTYEPTASALIKLGAHRVFDSRSIPDTIFDVLAVRRDRPINEGLLREVLVAHFKAVDHLRRHQEDAILRIAQHQAVTASDVRAALAGVVIPSLSANRAYLHDQSSQLQSAARAISRLMIERGMLKGTDALDALLMPEMLPSEGA